ncbi:MAG TPA: hypothetical protein VF221_20080, partial [Chloroflexota bacterium]
MPAQTVAVADVPPTSRSAGSVATSARRSATSTRRTAPTLAINYSYLRGDITALTVLAPSMVVLLI